MSRSGSSPTCRCRAGNTLIDASFVLPADGESTPYHLPTETIRAFLRATGRGRPHAGTATGRSGMAFESQQFPYFRIAVG